MTLHTERDYNELVMECANISVNAWECEEYTDKMPSKSYMEKIVNNETRDYPFTQSDFGMLMAYYYSCYHGTILDTMTVSEMKRNAIDMLVGDVLEYIFDELEDYMRDIVWRTCKSEH